MTIATLASASLEAGRALLIKLDELGLNPECVAWLHPHDSEGWQYIVGTGAVDVVGPSKLYMGLINLFDALDFGSDLTIDRPGVPDAAEFSDPVLLQLHLSPPDVSVLNNCRKHVRRNRSRTSVTTISSVS